jgi:hypothetical protein
LTCGRSLDYFLDAYSGVTKEQAEAVIQWEQNEARRIFGVELVA